MKTKTIPNFGIIFAVALTMVTTAVFTACNSEDDFGGDFNGDITGQYSLATRMMTNVIESARAVTDTTLYKFNTTLTTYNNDHGFDATVFVEFRHVGKGELEVSLVEYEAPPMCRVGNASLLQYNKDLYILSISGQCEHGVICSGKCGDYVYYGGPK